MAGSAFNFLSMFWKSGTFYLLVLFYIYKKSVYLN